MKHRKMSATYMQYTIIIIEIVVRKKRQWLKQCLYTNSMEIVIKKKKVHVCTEGLP